jgi:ubiquinone/menaquinone biosynthesis C-methylase UbiE
VNPEEYIRLSRSEEQLWWYRALHGNLLTLLGDAAKQAPGGAPPGRALDIGGGTGALARRLRQVGYEVVAIDISMLAVGELRKQGAGISSAVADANGLPFSDESFDLVVCVDVLECQAIKPDCATSEALRVLKPGGIGLFQMAAHQWLLSEHDRAVHSVRRFALPAFLQLFNPSAVKILRATYLFFLLFPLMSLWKLARRPRTEMALETATSDVVLPPRLINSLLECVSSLDSFFLRFFNLPMGTSVCVVVTKLKKDA